MYLSEESRELAYIFGYNEEEFNELIKPKNNYTNVKKISIDIENLIIYDYLNTTLSLLHIAKKYSTNKSAVINLLSKHNLLNRSHKISDEIEILIREDLKNLSIKCSDICKKYNVSSTVLRKIRRKYNIPLRNEKVSKEIELLICHDYINTKLTLIQIADKYDIEYQTVIQIRKRNNIPKRDFRARTNPFLINENFFENFNNKKTVFWAGILMADGHLFCKENCSGFSIRLAIKDLIILQQFKNDLNSTHNIKIGFQFDKRVNKSYEYCKLRVFNNKIFKDLEKNGVLRSKSKELHLPKINDELMKSLLQGYILGDGCWTIRKKRGKKAKIGTMRFSLVASSKEILEEIMNFLCRVCNLKKTKIYTKGNYFTFDYGGNLQCKRIFEKIYYNTIFEIDRKFQLLKKFFNEYTMLYPNSKKENKSNTNMNIIKFGYKFKKFNIKKVG